jgi:hypothetical protein
VGFVDPLGRDLKFILLSKYITPQTFRMRLRLAKVFDKFRSRNDITERGGVVLDVVPEIQQNRADENTYDKKSAW